MGSCRQVRTACTCMLLVSKLCNQLAEDTHVFSCLRGQVLARSRHSPGTRWCSLSMVPVLTSM
jgi:hypothetical protein